jgi:hypothetical protein
MTALRATIEIFACVITWYGIEPTLKLADSILRYLYTGTVEL